MQSDKLANTSTVALNSVCELGLQGRAGATDSPADQGSDSLVEGFGRNVLMLWPRKSGKSQLDFYRSRLLWSFMLKSYGIRWNERNGIRLISCRLIAALLNMPNQEAEIKEIGMIGPATVGGIKTTPWKTGQTRQTRLCSGKVFFWTKAWVHSHWQHRRGDASANGWRMVDGRRWYAGQCGHVETLSPWISQWAQLFCCFLLQVNVHMTIRLRDIFGTLQLSDYQLARCVMLLPEVAYVSKSGGMSNELVCQTCICACEPWCPTSMSITCQNNIIARNSNGVYEGVAIGGDRWASGASGASGARVSPICWSSLMGIKLSAFCCGKVSWQSLHWSSPALPGKMKTRK